MKIHPAIIAIIVSAFGLAVTAPNSRAAGATNNIPGQSKAQKDQREARLNSARSSGRSAVDGHAKHYHSKKTGR